MSRSGYNDDIDDQLQFGRWRGAVESAIRGKRGQAFLKEMLAALDALPEKKLITGHLESDGAVCALGAVGKMRGLDMTGIDPHDSERVAGKFGIAYAMTCEIVFMNDEEFNSYWCKTPEERFTKMREWVVRGIKPSALVKASKET